MDRRKPSAATVDADRKLARRWYNKIRCMSLYATALPVAGRRPKRQPWIGSSPRSRNFHWKRRESRWNIHYMKAVLTTVKLHALKTGFPSLRRQAHDNLAFASCRPTAHHPKYVVGLFSSRLSQVMALSSQNVVAASESAPGIEPRADALLRFWSVFSTIYILFIYL